ncbi:competence/damage-inducible protein A [Thermoanaerobacterium sp. DL9XJH110]|uniref:competence/damage-inducible protein A n=1 Tax=Thermoanaerobacterium sp. DL9XJH110 TaxID=3386643 RepID=UPI003BB61BF5
MKAETIAVGSELLLGQIANTNAQIISRALQEIGIDVYFHTCVGDNRDRIIEVFKEALGRSDVIITTGGLGPTMDDLTKETIASYIGLPLKVDEDSLERIKSFFSARGRHMTENNYKQALIPEGATAILNKKGTAPGVLLNYKGRIIVMLPGPPYEMEPMLRDTVIPYLSKWSSKTIYSRVMKFYGIGESQLEETIKDLLVNQSNPTIAPLAKKGEVTLRLTAKADDFLKANELIRPLEEEIKRRVGRYLYGYDDETVEEIVARLLFKYNKTIAVAESCTGGLLAHKLTNIPGISKQFERGVVSYSNNSKLELLGVKKETLEKFGAVSEQTAVEMARGIRLTSRTDIGVSITGIAGPDGGTLEKPVGLVYIGYADSDSSCAEKHIFSGDRIDIKERSADAALHLVRKKLQDSGD